MTAEKIDAIGHYGRYRAETFRLDEGAAGGMDLRLLTSYHFRTLSIRPDQWVWSLSFTPADARALAAKLLAFADEFEAAP